MTDLALVRPGDIGFMDMGGVTGVGIWAAQRIVDNTVPSEYRVRHVLVVTEAEWDRGNVFAPKAVQAMPHGAEEIELTPERHGDTIFVRPAYDEVWGNMAERVAAAACRYVDTPYSFLDYAAIAARHLEARKPTDRTPFDRYITSTGHMICSQLADQAMSDAGWHVFDDGRLPQDVTPAALYRQMLLMPHTIVGA